MVNFFLFKKNCRLLKQINLKWPQPQDKKWVIIQEYLVLYEHNFHVLRFGDQLLFANQEPNFNFETVSSLLSKIHASVKSYRFALFAFRINIVISIPVWPSGHFSMSLTPMETLLAIMHSVSLRESKAEDGLTLAIPANDLLSYYNFSLLADAFAVSKGLLLTFKISLA